MIPQHLHTPHSPGTSLSCTTSPSSTDQLITHLQLPSQVCVSSGCSEKRHVISIPTAPADCSFQFTFRCSLCRLHPLVPLAEAMSCNCSRFFGDSVSQKAEPQLRQPWALHGYHVCKMHFLLLEAWKLPCTCYNVTLAHLLWCFMKDQSYPIFRYIEYPILSNFCLN